MWLTAFAFCNACCRADRSSSWWAALKPHMLWLTRIVTQDHLFKYTFTMFWKCRALPLIWKLLFWWFAAVSTYNCHTWWYQGCCLIKSMVTVYIYEKQHYSYICWGTWQLTLQLLLMLMLCFDSSVKPIETSVIIIIGNNMCRYNFSYT